MSTSLNVVSMAAVFCASFKRRAIVWRSLDIFTRSSVPAAASGRATGAGAGTGAAGFSNVAITSPLVMRPSLPEPGISAGFKLFSTTALRTAGESGISAALAGAGTAAIGATAFGVSAPATPSAIEPNNAPMTTVVPDAAFILSSLPDAGAGTSTVTLSVSSSTKGSSTFTKSPSFLNHFAMVASVTDSPKVGTRISLLMFLIPYAIASSRKALSSFRWRLIKPVAVEADAGLPT